MKILKGLIALVFVGVIAGFVLSLLAPQLNVSPFDLGDVDDSDFDNADEDIF